MSPSESSRPLPDLTPSPRAVARPQIGQVTRAPSLRTRMQSLRTWAGRAVAIIRRIVGVPDYDAYLAHMQRQYPDCAPMDPRTFERERLAAKYTQPGSRCC